MLFTVSNRREEYRKMKLQMMLLHVDCKNWSCGHSEQRLQVWLTSEATTCLELWMLKIQNLQRSRNGWISTLDFTVQLPSTKQQWTKLQINNINLPLTQYKFLIGFCVKCEVDSFIHNQFSFLDSKDNICSFVGKI